MKFLCEGLIRNVMLREKITMKFWFLRGTDKKCNFEGLKVRMKFLCKGLITGLIKRNVEEMKVTMKFLCE